MSKPPADLRAAHWRRSRALILILLPLWALVTFGVIWLAPSMNWNFFGWRFSFYMGAQGSPLLCLVIVAVYAWAMDRIDRRAGLHSEEDA